MLCDVIDCIQTAEGSGMLLGYDINVLTFLCSHKVDKFVINFECNHRVTEKSILYLLSKWKRNCKQFPPRTAFMTQETPILPVAVEYVQERATVQS
jgi:hypothetical protein